MCSTEFKDKYCNPKRGRQFCNKSCATTYRNIHNNPQAGKRPWNYGIPQTDECKAKLSAALKGKGLGIQRTKGYKHTAESRAKISEANRIWWSNPANKASFIQQMSGVNNPRYNPNREEVRKRLGNALFFRFTRGQRAAWIKSACERCGSQDRLELDHRLAIMNGGINTEDNAQTLCRSCNIWKRNNVDFKIAAKRDELLETPTHREDNQQPSRENGRVVSRKVQRLSGEEPTNKPHTSVPHQPSW